MGVISWIEGWCGWLLFNFKNHEDKLFTKKPIFANVPCVIDVICTDTNKPNELDQKHEFLKDNQFPSISWKLEDRVAENVKSFVLVVQDIDIPLPFAALHGCFYNISADKRTFHQKDINDIRAANSEVRFIVNIMGSEYIGPRPLLSHGYHRYVYQVIGLNKSLDVSGKMKLAEFEKVLEDDIEAFGTWTGAYKRDA